MTSFLFTALMVGAASAAPLDGAWRLDPASGDAPVGWFARRVREHLASHPAEIELHDGGTVLDVTRDGFLGTVERHFVLDGKPHEGAGGYVMASASRTPDGAVKIHIEVPALDAEMDLTFRVDPARKDVLRLHVEAHRGENRRVVDKVFRRIAG